MYLDSEGKWNNNESTQQVGNYKKLLFINSQIRKMRGLQLY